VRGASARQAPISYAAPSHSSAGLEIGFASREAEKPLRVTRIDDAADATEVNAIERYVDRLLPINFDTLLFESPSQQRLVNAFQEARAKLAMQMKRGIHSKPCQTFRFQIGSQIERHSRLRLFAAWRKCNLRPFYTRIGIST
jgi:hypothetical protein